MNRIFKVIFSKVLGTNVVASETAKSHGKKSLKALVAVAMISGGMCQSVWADDVYTDADVIDKKAINNNESGIYNFRAGSFDDQLVDFDSRDFSKDVNITINIENKGLLTVSRKGSFALIDVYNGSDHPNPDQVKSDVKINGNLDLQLNGENKGYRNDFRAINLLNNNDYLTINGNTAISISNVNTEYEKYWVDGVRAFSGTMAFNGDFTIKNFTDIKGVNKGVVTGVYSTTIGSNVSGWFGGDNTNENSESHIVLGSNNDHRINIQNIKAEAQGSLSVIGILSEGDKSVVDVNGKLDISNLNGISNDDVEVMALLADDKGIINIKGDLVIDRIEGTGKTKEEVVALKVSNGGTIEVNKAKNRDRVIQITGDIDGGSIDDGDKLTLNLLNKDSLINGAIKGAGNGNAELNLSNGATWNATGDSTVKIIETDKATINLGQHKATINNYTANGNGADFNISGTETG